MSKRVYEMTAEERYQFEEDLTFLQLDGLDDNEIELLDQDVIQEVILDEYFVDIEDSISYKERFGIDLNEDEEYYLDWGDKVDEDLGLPLMSREMIATL